MNKYAFIFFFISNLASAQIIIQGKYDGNTNMYNQKKSSFWIGEFEGDLAKFSKGGYYGLINKKGEIILSMKYDEILITDSLLYANLKNDHYVYSQAGELVNKPIYDLIIKKKGFLYLDYLNEYLHFNPLAVSRPPADLREKIFQYGNELYDFDGNLLITLKDDNRLNFKEGLAVISEGPWNKKRYGFINSDGEIITPTVYDYCSGFQFGRSIVRLTNKNGVLDKKGNFIVPLTRNIPPQSNFNNGLCRYRDSITGKFGYIDLNGNLKILSKYNQAQNFYNGFAKVNKNGKPITIDVTGKEFRTPQQHYESGYRFETERGKIYYCSKKGEKIFRFSFDNDYRNIYFTEGLAVVKKADRFGVIDRLGKVIIPAIYDKIKIEEGYIFARLNGETWLVEKNGRKLVLIGDTASWGSANKSFSISNSFDVNGLLKTRKGNKIGLIDASGDKVLQNEFDNIYPQVYFIQATKNNAIGIYDLSGNLMIPHKVQNVVALSKSTILLKSKKTLHLYDRAFNLLFKVDEIDNDFSFRRRSEIAGLYVFRNTVNGKLGFIDLLNQNKVDPVYDLMHFLAKNKLLIAKKNNDNYAFLPPHYAPKKIDFEIVGTINKKILVARKEKRHRIAIEGLIHLPNNEEYFYGLINDRTEIILPFKYSRIQKIEDFKSQEVSIPNGAILFSKDNFGNHIFINQSGEIIPKK